MHVAVFMDVVAALKISANRAVAESLSGGIMSPQNIPLLFIVAAIVFLTEFLPQKKTSNFHFLLFLIASAILLWCSFYLPPAGRSAEEPSVIAYAALMIQFAAAIVIALYRRLDIGKILAGIICVVAIFTAAGFAYTFSNGETYPEALNSDGVVVLGASVWGKHTPSPILRGRLEEE